MEETSGVAQAETQSKPHWLTQFSDDIPPPIPPQILADLHLFLGYSFGELPYMEEELSNIVCRSENPQIWQSSLPSGIVFQQFVHRLVAVRLDWGIGNLCNLQSHSSVPTGCSHLQVSLSALNFFIDSSIHLLHMTVCMFFQKGYFDSRLYCMVVLYAGRSSAYSYFSAYANQKTTVFGSLKMNILW